MFDGNQHVSLNAGVGPQVFSVYLKSLDLIIVSASVSVPFLWTLDFGFGTGLGLDNYMRPSVYDEVRMTPETWDERVSIADSARCSSVMPRERGPSETFLASSAK